MTQALVGASAPLPFKAPASADLPSASEWLLAILLCAALLFAIVWLLRRQQAKLHWGSRQASLLKVLDRQALSPHVQLVVLQYQGRQLLLSVGPASTQCLRDEPHAPHEQAAGIEPRKTSAESPA